mmetsp:Transcript_101386/g.302360  ORF Transcript_101386/g.302360 Transcript_101386/m.302360 type:complete len:311 (+) Transcript_101386:256-1188(+)
MAGAPRLFQLLGYLCDGGFRELLLRLFLRDLRGLLSLRSLGSRRLLHPLASLPLLASGRGCAGLFQQYGKLAALAGEDRELVGPALQEVPEWAQDALVTGAPLPDPDVAHVPRLLELVCDFTYGGLRLRVRAGVRIRQGHVRTAPWLAAALGHGPGAFDAPATLAAPTAVIAPAAAALGRAALAACTALAALPRAPRSPLGAATSKGDREFLAHAGGHHEHVRVGLEEASQGPQAALVAPPPVVDPDVALVSGALELRGYLPDGSVGGALPGVSIGERKVAAALAGVFPALPRPLARRHCSWTYRPLIDT